MYVRKKTVIAEIRETRETFQNLGADVSNFPIHAKADELEVQISFKISARKKIACAFNFSHVVGHDDLWEVKFVHLTPAILKGLNAHKLAKDIDLLECKVKEYCLRVESAECWEEIVDAVKRYLTRGSAEDLEFTNFYKETLTGKGYTAHVAPVVITVAYCIDARKALEETDLNRAFFCVDRGAFFVWEGFLVKDRHGTLRGRAGLGGVSKANQRFEPVKLHVIELLRSLVSPTGWKSKAEAARQLQDPVREFISFLSKDKEKPVLDYANFERTLYSWIAQDARIREAYENNKKMVLTIEETAEDQ